MQPVYYASFYDGHVLLVSILITKILERRKSLLVRSLEKFEDAKGGLQKS